MPRKFLILTVTAQLGCGRVPTGNLVGEGQVLTSPEYHRVFEVHLVATESTQEPGVASYQARATAHAGAMPETSDSRVVDECAYRQLDQDNHGVGVGATVELEFGRTLVLEWDASTGSYMTEEVGDGRDLAWQPVSAKVTGGAWWLEAPGALQFGEAPEVWVQEERVGGDLLIQWASEYPSESLELIVETSRGELVCPSHGDSAVVPWWALGSGDFEIWLSATRREQTLLPDATLVVGYATLRVPVLRDGGPGRRSAAEDRPEPGVSPAVRGRGWLREWWRSSARRAAPVRPS